MQKNYTPGPYNLTFLEDNYDSSESSLRITSPLPDGGLLVLSTVNVRAFAPHMKEPLATATIMAAAPELAEALELLLREYIRTTSAPLEVVDKLPQVANARQALQKAGLL